MTAPTAVPGAITRNNIGRGNAQWIKLAPSPEPVRVLGPSKSAYDWLPKTAPPPDINYFDWKLSPVEGAEIAPEAPGRKSRMALDILLFPSPIPPTLVARAPTPQSGVGQKKTQAALDLLLFPSPTPPTLVSRGVKQVTPELRVSTSEYDWLLDIPVPSAELFNLITRAPLRVEGGGVAGQSRSEYDWLLDAPPTPPTGVDVDFIIRARRRRSR